MKVCAGCKRELDEQQFDRDPRPNSLRRLRSRCKACRLAERRKYRKGGRPVDVLTDVGLDIDIEWEAESDDVIAETIAYPDPYPSVPEVTYDPEFDGIGRVLFIPDCHLPFHHRENFDIMLRAGLAFKPDVVIVLGDLFDFYAVNAHGKRPDRNGSLKWEVAEGLKYLKQIEQLGARKQIYIEGNHEYRFERYIESRAPDLFGMTTVPQILDLGNRWTWVPYKKSYRLGKIHVTHDVGTAGRNAARQAMDVFQGSATIGHTHRMEMSFMGAAAGPPSVGAMFGWLGDPSHADYMHLVQAQRNWIQGFGTGYMRPGGIIHLVPCPIVDRAVVIEGRLIT